MELSKNLKIQFQLIPELKQRYADAVIVSDEKSAAVKQKKYRIVLCENPLGTAEKSGLIVFDDSELRKVLPSASQLKYLQLRYEPRKMEYDAVLHMLSGEGCMIVNSMPVILSCDLLSIRNFLSDAAVIYRMPEKIFSVSEKQILKKYIKVRDVLSDEELRKNLIPAYSGQYETDMLLLSNEVPYINLPLFSIQPDFPLSSDELFGEISAAYSENECSVKMRNDSMKAFDKAFASFFRTGIANMPVNDAACFTGCYIAVELYGRYRDMFFKEAAKIAQQYANKLMHSSGAIRKRIVFVEYTDEIVEKGKYDITELCREITDEWRKITCWN